MKLNQEVIIKEDSPIADVYALSGEFLKATITEINHGYYRVSNSVVEDVIITDADIE